MFVISIDAYHLIISNLQKKDKTMAFLIKNIFGGLTGPLGNNIFRSRYGNTVAYKNLVNNR